MLLAAEDRDDDQHEAAIRLLRTGSLATLELAGYEVTNVAEFRWRDPSAGERLRQRVWAIAELGVLVRLDPELELRTAEIARQHDLSAYDAAYVAGAERVGLQLASCDRRDLVSRGLATLPSDMPI